MDATDLVEVFDHLFSVLDVGAGHQLGQHVANDVPLHLDLLGYGDGVCGSKGSRQNWRFPLQMRVALK